MQHTKLDLTPEQRQAVKDLVAQLFGAGVTGEVTVVLNQGGVRSVKLAQTTVLYSSTSARKSSVDEM